MGMFDTLIIRRFGKNIELQTKTFGNSLDRYYIGDEISLDKHDYSSQKSGVRIFCEQFTNSLNVIIVLHNNIWIDYAIINLNETEKVSNHLLEIYSNKQFLLMAMNRLYNIKSSLSDYQNLIINRNLQLIYNENSNTKSILSSLINKINLKSKYGMTYHEQHRKIHKELLENTQHDFYYYLNKHQDEHYKNRILIIKNIKKLKYSFLFSEQAILNLENKKIFDTELFNYLTIDLGVPAVWIYKIAKNKKTCLKNKEIYQEILLNKTYKILKPYLLKKTQTIEKYQYIFHKNAEFEGLYKDILHDFTKKVDHSFECLKICLESGLLEKTGAELIDKIVSLDPKKISTENLKILLLAKDSSYFEDYPFIVNKITIYIEQIELAKIKNQVKSNKNTFL